MRYQYDFLQNCEVTARLVAAIQNLDARSFVRLKSAGALHLKRYEFEVTFKALDRNYLSDYLTATKMSAHELFYGYEKKIDNAYSKDDDFLIYCLDLMKLSEKKTLLSYLKLAFPNQQYDLGRDLRPSRKLMDALIRKPKGFVQLKGNRFHPEIDTSVLTEASIAELQRYANSHQNSTFVFNTDCWVNLARYVGISLHWLWNMDMPLYCNSNIGDDIFDYYTMMQPSEKEVLIKIASAYIKQKQKGAVQNG